MKVVLINGYPGSGKTTFVDMCADLNHQTYNFSTVDFVKYIAKQMGWNGEKTPESRKFLSDLKDLMSNSPWGDLPVLDIEKKIRVEQGSLESYGLGDKRLVIFIDVREPENMVKLKEKFNAISLLIWRPDVEGTQSNHADSDVLKCQYDYVITNDKDLVDLRDSAQQFLDLIFS